MFFTYIITNQRNGTLYIGHTDNLWARMEAHIHERFPGFASRYGLKRLVWFEIHPTRDDAFKRERQMKLWKREWKIRVIEEMNPHWKDLHEGSQWMLDPDNFVSRNTGPLPAQG